jgi:hypothetical protein
MTDKEELEIALMNAQIETLLAEREKLQTETDRFRQEMRWEPWKAFAAIVGGVLVGIAAMVGAIIGLATWLAPHLR